MDGGLPRKAPRRRPLMKDISPYEVRAKARPARSDRNFAGSLVGQIRE